MLENLVIAVESEPQIVDLGRVAGFMQKVLTAKTGILLCLADFSVLT